MKLPVGRSSSRIINILCKDEDLLKRLKDIGIKKRRITASYASLEVSFLEDKYRLFFEELIPSFIKKCIFTQRSKLASIGIDEKNLDLMTIGEIPKGYSVKHQIPLELGGKNRISNLILIPCNIAQTTYIDFINWQNQKLIEYLPKGEDILIFQTLIFPEDIFISLPKEAEHISEISKSKVMPILIQKRDIRFKRYFNFFSKSIFKDFFSLEVIKIKIPSLKSRHNTRKEYEKYKKHLIQELFRINKQEIIKYFGRFSPELEGFENSIIPLGWTVHHILPISCGGSNNLSNLLIIHNSVHELMNDNIYTPQLDKFAVFGEEYEGRELSIAILKPKASFFPLVIKRQEDSKRLKVSKQGFSLG